MLKANPISSTDIVTIFGGTNDYTGGSTIGEIGSTDITTITGALSGIIDMILEVNPNIQIYILTPIVRYISNTIDDDHWSDNHERSRDKKKLTDVVDVIIKVSRNRHIPCKDMYWELGWNQTNFFNYFNSSDTTHPFKGFRYIAEKIFKYITSV